MGHGPTWGRDAIILNQSHDAENYLNPKSKILAPSQNVQAKLDFGLGLNLLV
jgi:hypothetical protein